jgi:hypothetical protein
VSKKSEKLIGQQPVDTDQMTAWKSEANGVTALTRVLLNGINLVPVTAYQLSVRKILIFEFMPHRPGLNPIQEFGSSIPVVV